MAAVGPPLPPNVPGPAQDYAGFGNTQLLLESGAADGAAAGALVRRTARANLFSSPQWVAALHSLGLSHFDASHPALAPALGALTASGEPPSECRLPSLLAVVVHVARTGCGDCAVLLADPSGEADALFMADVSGDVRVGTAVHITSCAVLCPAFSPRMMCLLIAQEHVANLWQPQQPPPVVAPAVHMVPQQAPPPPHFLQQERVDQQWHDWEVPIAPSAAASPQQPAPPMIAPAPAPAAPSPLPQAAAPMFSMGGGDLGALDIDDEGLL
jgi:hypothetical protein